MVRAASIELLKKSLPTVVDLYVDSPQQELAVAIARATENKHCRYEEDVERPIYELPLGVMVEHLGDDWKKKLEQTGIKAEQRNEPVMGRPRVYFDKAQTDTFITDQLLDKTTAAANVTVIDKAFDAAGLISPTKLKKLESVVSATTASGSLIFDRTSLKEILGAEHWANTMTDSGLAYRKVTGSGNNINNSEVAVIPECVDALHALHRQMAFALIVKSLDHIKKGPAPALPPEADLVVETPTLVRTQPEAARESVKPAALSAQVAQALLKLGDRETVTTVVERAKVPSRTETPAGDARLVITLALQPGDGGLPAMEKMDQHLASYGATREALHAAGFIGTKASIRVDGEKVEYSVPMAAMEKIAGISWEAANPAVRFVQKRVVG